MKEVKDRPLWKEENGEEENEEDLLVINPGRFQTHSLLQSHCCSAFLDNEIKMIILQ